MTLSSFLRAPRGERRGRAIATRVPVIAAAQTRRGAAVGSRSRGAATGDHASDRRRQRATAPVGHGDGARRRRSCRIGMRRWHADRAAGGQRSIR
jgi:hypothetical protein